MIFQYDFHSRSKTYFQYDCRQRDAQDGYELIFSLSEPELLAPAKTFKKFLKESDQYKSFQKKTDPCPPSKRWAAPYMLLFGETSISVEIPKT